MNKILLAIAFLFLLGCDVSSSSVCSDETDEAYQLYDYYIDSYGNEGIVVNITYTTTDKVKYIIVLSDDETVASWGPMGELVWNADTISNKLTENPRYGLTMLQCMYSRGIDRFPAQDWCNRKNGNESPRTGSWRLPSFEEFEYIYGDNGSKVDDINKALYNIGGTPVDIDEMYWTCNEDYDRLITIGGQYYDYDKWNRAVTCTPDRRTFTNKDHWIKKDRHHVRAIKYIYYLW